MPSGARVAANRRRGAYEGLEPPNTMQEYKEIYVCVCLFAKLTPKSDPGSTKPSFVPMEYFQSFLFFGLLEFVDDRL